MNKKIVFAATSFLITTSIWGTALAKPHNLEVKKYSQLKSDKTKQYSPDSLNKDKIKNEKKNNKDNDKTQEKVETEKSQDKNKKQDIKEPINSKVNKENKSKIPSVIKMGKLLIPTNAVTKGIKATLTYDASIKTVTISKDGITIQFIGDSKVLVNGKEVNMASVKKGRGRITPLQFINETFKAKVSIPQVPATTDENQQNTNSTGSIQTPSSGNTDINSTNNTQTPTNTTTGGSADTTQTSATVNP